MRRRPALPGAATTADVAAFQTTTSSTYRSHACRSSFNRRRLGSTSHSACVHRATRQLRRRRQVCARCESAVEARARALAADAALQPLRVHLTGHAGARARARARCCHRPIGRLADNNNNLRRGVKRRATAIAARRRDAQCLARERATSTSSFDD